jgi:hypothetical protein
MKYRLLVLILFLGLPSVSASPRTFISTCDVQMRIRDGRDPEGLAIRGQRAEFILPCVTKEELARIIEDFAKGDAERKDRALDALRRSKQVTLMITPETAMREKD